MNAYYTHIFFSDTETCICRWMVRLGFTLVNLKGMYLDGHERADVVKFRRQFVSAMAVYEKFMENYETKKDGDGNVISHTTVAAEDCRKKIVWVTHDESCAKANDSNNHAYLFHQDATDGSKESKPPMSKNEGASYMVSGFVCPCHGFMQVTQEQVDHYNQQIDQLNQAAGAGAGQRPHFIVGAQAPAGYANDAHPLEAWTWIKPGVNRDGYWKNEHLVHQFNNKAAHIFRILHPGCEALFLFDNSANHHMMRSDARNAFIMTLKDGGNPKEVHLGRQAGWFFKADGLKVTQPMDIEKRLKVPGGAPGDYQLVWETKGLKTILEERGLWSSGLKLEDAQNLLNAQPDFQDQMEWLEEVVTSQRGVNDEKFHVYFYPKFHPEFNPIERMWGAAKTRLRAECKHEFQWLVESFPKFLREIPLPQIQRYFRGARRYWDAYREKEQVDKDGRRTGSKVSLTPSQIEFAVKLYKSHRGIPSSILKDLEDLEIFGSDPLPRSGPEHDEELNWNLADVVANPIPAEGADEAQEQLDRVMYSSAAMRQESRKRRRGGDGEKKDGEDAKDGAEPQPAAKKGTKRSKSGAVEDAAKAAPAKKKQLAKQPLGEGPTGSRRSARSTAVLSNLARRYNGHLEAIGSDPDDSSG